jgi:site-specific DNA recombinase
VIVNPSATIASSPTSRVSPCAIVFVAMSPSVPFACNSEVALRQSCAVIRSRAQRCVIYARLSVTKEESVSIARQLESCRRYAEARGWEVVGEFVDDGVSATANRPEHRRGWSSLLAADDFDAVVIWKVDRLARRVLDFLHADEALQARGAGLVAVEDPIDMTSPQGRAFAVMLAVFGEMEAEAIRARVRAARAQLLKDGRWPGGGIPYGYASAPNPDGPGRVLVKDAERIQWLSEAVGMALRGEAVNAIARWLTVRGAPLPDRRPVEDRKAGSNWTRQTVVGLLRNPILAGMTPFNPGRGRSGQRVDPFAVVRDAAGEPVVNELLAVIGIDEFAELQQLLDARDVPQARKRGERRSTSAFLSRVVRCDDCGVFMCRGTNQQRPVLTCPQCRQTLSRTPFDPYLVRRLLVERGDEPLSGATVRQRWEAVGTDELARREILLTQLDALRIRRGVVGRYFDADRVLLTWRKTAAPGANATSMSEPPTIIVAVEDKGVSHGG